GVEQVLPKRVERGVRCVDRARGPPRLVPQGEGAGLGAGRQVRHQPLLLGRTRGVRDLGVERDDVPGAQVVGVVALGRVTGGGTEVAVVAGGTRRVVLVVTRRGLGTCLLPPRAPGRVVVGVVLRGGAAVVGVVAEGVDRTGDVVQQGGGRRLAGA